MGFLCVLGFGLVDPSGGGKVRLAKLRGDDVAGLCDGFRGDLNAVCTHIGDETGCLPANFDTFIKALGHLHCTAGRET